MHKIGFDLMGGDNAPMANIAAAHSFLKSNKSGELFLFGTEEHKHLFADNARVSYITTSEVIKSDEEPVFAIRRKKDSSLVVGAKYLNEKKIDCFISAGSTAAIIASGVFIVRRIEGIERPAITGLLPSSTKAKPTLLLDLGANVEPKTSHMMQYAMIANIYMRDVLKVSEPKIALLNIGTESNKGTTLLKETYSNLEQSNFNFVGNIEAREVLTTSADIILMDGLSGNVMLKTLEGSVAFFNTSLKEIFKANALTLLAAILVKSKLMNFKKQLDYKEIGATPVFGVDGLLLKAHGSSDEKAFLSALNNVDAIIESDFINKVKRGIENE